MSWVLWPLSLVYGFLVEVRNTLYNLGLIPVHRYEIPTISIGNIAVGGTGKSPWVIFLAKKLKSMGYRPAVVSRGYGGNYHGVFKVESHSPPEVCGDEPLMIRKLADCPVYLCRKRPLAVEQILKSEEVNILLVDDGFQHRRLSRHGDWVLFDASWPLWKYRLLPFGRLRESLKSLNRATLVVLNKWDQASVRRREHLKSTIQKYANDLPVVYSRYRALEIEPLFAHKSFGSPQQESFGLLSAIAAPESFLETVRKMGIEPVDTFFFPDHHQWKSQELEKVLVKLKSRNVGDLIVTEKDATKLRKFESLWQSSKTRVWVLRVEVEVHENLDQMEKEIQRVLGELS